MHVADNVSDPFIVTEPVWVNIGVLIVPLVTVNALLLKVCTKLVLAVIVPLVIVNVLNALIVQVVQDIVPMLLKVPAVYDTAPEQVKFCELKLTSPAVCV